MVARKRGFALTIAVVGETENGRPMVAPTSGRADARHRLHFPESTGAALTIAAPKTRFSCLSHAEIRSPKGFWRLSIHRGGITTNNCQTEHQGYARNGSTTGAAGDFHSPPAKSCDRCDGIPSQKRMRTVGKRGFSVAARRKESNDIKTAGCPENGAPRRCFLPFAEWSRRAVTGARTSPDRFFPE